MEWSILANVANIRSFMATAGRTVIYKTRVETQYVTKSAGSGSVGGSSLSAGDIAGIAVGAVGAILFIAALVFYFLRR